MSNVRVCDRCGRKIEKPGMKIDIRAYKYHRFLLNCEREFSHGVEDLCAVCMKDFYAFMDGAEIAREEEASARVAYICDGKACDECNPECHHISDIRHARNFECIAENEYWEKEPDYKKILDEIFEMLNMYCDDGNEIYIKKRVLEINMKSILEEFTNTDVGDETGD